MMSIDVLIIGTGEYVTGLTHGSVIDSDKSLGVIGIVLFDLRRRGLVNTIRICGQRGNRFPLIRKHFRKNIADTYQEMNVEFTQYPEDDEYDSRAWHHALAEMAAGGAVIIVTPDDSHYEMAKAALEKGLQVLVVKPLVKSLKEHQALNTLAQKHNLLLATEMHKRFDPFYMDARDRAENLGDFSHFYSYMSQPKHQLDTFSQWAGKSSDISYYLNSHHVDWLVWCLSGRTRPETVSALAATGVASNKLGVEMEDTITLNVQWRNLGTHHLAMSSHTASWIAPKTDAHSQQRFFYMGHEGELQVDQAHRGYQQSTSAGYASLNPLFMKYTPTNGYFSGQQGYGYLSIAYFIEAALARKKGEWNIMLEERLAKASETQQVTAILEAGRQSLDAGGKITRIAYTDGASIVPAYISAE
jgi:D-galacturonate reductase